MDITKENMKCNICKRKFNSNDSLMMNQEVSHMSNISDFPCGLCATTFSIIHSVKDQMDNDHTIKCDGCKFINFELS